MLCMLCKVCVHNHTAEAHGTQPTTTSAHVLRIANVTGNAMDNGHETQPKPSIGL